MNERAWKQQEEMAKAAAADSQRNWAREQALAVTQAQVTAGIGPGARQSAQGYIRERARRLRDEAQRLEALADALPPKLPPEADEALWSLAAEAGR